VQEGEGCSPEFAQNDIQRLGNCDAVLDERASDVMRGVAAPMPEMMPVAIPQSGQEILERKMKLLIIAVFVETVETRFP